MKKLTVKKVKGVSKSELTKIIGGRVDTLGLDSKDCNSELACGGTTTDTYESFDVGNKNRS